MIISLPNGKVIERTVEQYLKMTDEDFQYLMATNAGDEINNPFFGSYLDNESSIEEIEDDYDFEKEPSIEDLTEIPDELKFIDDEYIDPDLLNET